MPTTQTAAPTITRASTKPATPNEQAPLRHLDVARRLFRGSGAEGGPTLGEGGERLHDWAFAVRTFRKMHDMEGGATGLDDDVAAGARTSGWAAARASRNST